MRRNLACFGNRNTLGQEETTSVSRIADPLWNPRAPSEPSSVESVLQQKRHIEFQPAQLRRQALAPENSRMNPLRIIYDELITYFLLAIEFGHIRPCQNCNLCL